MSTLELFWSPADLGFGVLVKRVKVDFIRGFLDGVEGAEVTTGTSVFVGSSLINVPCLTSVSVVGVVAGVDDLLLDLEPKVELKLRPRKYFGGPEVVSFLAAGVLGFTAGVFVIALGLVGSFFTAKGGLLTFLE